jgi:hypothetical protein
MVFASDRPDARSRLLTNLLGATTLSSLTVVACSILAAVRLDPRGIGTVELLLLGSGILVTNVTEAARCSLIGCSEFRAQALVLAAWPWTYAGLLLAFAITRGLSVAATSAAGRRRLELPQPR